MKLLAFFVLQGLREKLDELFSPEENFLNYHIFGTAQREEVSFTFYSSLLTMKVTMRPLAVPKDCINSNPYGII
jgi:hypothetical protein